MGHAFEFAKTLIDLGVVQPIDAEHDPARLQPALVSDIALHQQLFPPAAGLRRHREVGGVGDVRRTLGSVILGRGFRTGSEQQHAEDHGCS